MLGRSGARAQVRSYAVFDIGASSIGAGIAVRTGDTVDLIWHTRTEYAFERATEYERYEKTMYATLLEVGMQLTSEGVRIAGQHPGFSARSLEVVCVLGSPWFFGAVRDGTKKADASFEVTHALLDELHAHMVTEVTASDERTAWGEVMGDAELLETYDGALYLDGYKVARAQGRRAHACTVRTYLALVPQRVIEHVQDVLHRVVPNHHLTITSSMRLMFHACTDASAAGIPNDLMVLEIGGQITTMSLIRHSIPAGVAMFPVGTHDFLRAIAPDAKTSKEAEGVYAALTKAAGEGAEYRLPTELRASGDAWRESLHEKLIELADGVTPPRTVYVMAMDQWRAPFTALLSTPFHLPGIRKELPFDIMEAQVDASTSATTTMGSRSDERLRMFARSVDEHVLRAA